MFAVDEVDAGQEKHCRSPMEGFRLETDYRLPTKTDSGCSDGSLILSSGVI